MATKKTMHGVQYDKFGGGASALKHVEEIPIPTPKKGEILMKVEASSLNPADIKIQKGVIRFFIPKKLPFIPVTDVAGEVIEVGPEVQNFKPGDKVVIFLPYWMAGGLAEYAVGPSDSAAHRPHEVTAVQGAGLPLAGLTALQALTKYGAVKLDGNDNPIMNVLVTAATGGVGHYAVQLAKLGNAHVTATCGARNVELVKSLGADEVLDYKTPEGESLKSPSGKKYDLVVVCNEGMKWSTLVPNLTECAKVVLVSPPTLSMAAAMLKTLFCKKSVATFLMKGSGEELELLVRLMKEGKIKTIVDTTFSLEKAGEAWNKYEEGHATGKIIITHC